jgi:hypothetical protein
LTSGGPICIDPRRFFCSRKVGGSTTLLQNCISVLADLQSWRASPPLAKSASGSVTFPSPSVKTGALSLSRADESEFGTKFGSRFYHPLEAALRVCVCDARARFDQTLPLPVIKLLCKVNFLCAAPAGKQASTPTAESRSLFCFQQHSA